MDNVYDDFLSGSDDKESSCNAGDLGSIPGSGRSTGEGNGNPLQYSYLENSMDRRAWQTAVHGVAHKELDKTEQLTLSISLMCVCMCVSLCVCVCVYLLFPISHLPVSNGILQENSEHLSHSRNPSCCFPNTLTAFSTPCLV